MQRLLRLLMLLSGNRRYTAKEILKKIDCSERTIYRYLETIESAGFIMEKQEATYRLQKGGQTNSLQKLLHFSEEEVVVLYETLSLIEGTSSIKEQLVRNLAIAFFGWKNTNGVQHINAEPRLQAASLAVNRIAGARRKQQGLLLGIERRNRLDESG